MHFPFPLPPDSSSLLFPLCLVTPCLLETVVYRFLVFVCILILRCFIYSFDNYESQIELSHTSELN